MTLPRAHAPYLSPQVIMDLDKKLSLRIIASVALFLIFTVLATAAALSHRLDDQAPFIFGLLLASILIMPRQLPRPPQPTEAQLDRLARIQLWLAYTRAAYFLTALLVLFGLPKLVSP
jgi:hypothetical protein